MPDVVCMNLQDAQDYIQASGVFYSRSDDATGDGRMQIIDSNWQVVAQSPASGTPFGEGDALLYVVKYGEQPNPCG
jgi:beta-lactam-binding protein with PASTA domain